MVDHAISEATARRLDKRLATQQSSGRIPSLVAGLVRDGKLVWSGARGDTGHHDAALTVQYRIGSITKTFVAVAILRLRDAGKLHLNDTVERHIPGSALADRTVAQLLTHTGGVAAELPGSWWERSPGVESAGVESAMALGVNVSTPGDGFHYSNPAFAVLGEIVARAGGRDWFSVVSDEILAPLEMVDTSALPREPFARGWAVHPYADVLLPEVVQDTKAMGPAGQMWSTVPDLARWAALWAGDAGEVLSPDTVTEMCQPRTIADASQWTAGHGLGVQVWRDDKRLTVGHGGSMPGFVAGLSVDRGSGIGYVQVANCTTTSAVDGLENVFDVMDECEPRLPKPWRPDPSVSADLLELTGSWFWGTSEGTMRIEAGGFLKLTRVSGMVSTSRFRPVGDGSWVGLDEYYTGERLRVLRDAHGAVRQLDIGTFVFTRRPYEPADSVPGGLEPGGWQVG